MQEPDIAVTKNEFPSQIKATEEPTPAAKVNFQPWLSGVAPGTPANTFVPFDSAEPVKKCAWSGEALLKTNKPPGTLDANGMVTANAAAAEPEIVYTPGEATVEFALIADTVATGNELNVIVELTSTPEPDF